MEAAVLEKFGEPLALREVEVPSIGPLDVLVRVRACGLCGTDLKIASGKISEVTLPLIPGHEIAGEIHQIGDQVSGMSVGDRVAVHFYLSCGRCRLCETGQHSLCENLKGQLGFHRNGGLAEFVKAPASNVRPLGDAVTFPQAAILADAVATPYQALRRHAKLQEGDVLVVVGAGGLGLHAIQIAKALGASVVAIDVDEPHLEKAAELGADIVLHPARDNILDAVKGKSNGRGADVVIDLVGHPETIEKDLACLGPAGTLLVVGYHPTRQFSVPPLEMIRKGVKIIGCRASGYQDLADVITWVEEKKIVPVVEDVLPLREVNDAYERLREGKVIGRLVIAP